VNITDAAAFGDYTYPPDAISPNCHEQRLEIFPAKNSAQPVVKIIEAKTIDRIWSDFAAFRAAPDTPAPPKTDAVAAKATEKN
jgi:hypothetical protein